MSPSFNLIRNPGNRNNLRPSSSHPAQSRREDAFAAGGDPSLPPSESATFIAQHEYLLTQILIELPSKSLLRFQCVSKNWLSLISDPDFRRRWGTIRKDLSPDLLFFTPGVKQIGINFLSVDSEGVASAAGVFNFDPINEIIKATHNHEQPSLTSVHCCNGLWCVQIGLDSLGAIIVVCNPTTWKHRVIQVPMKKDYDGTPCPTFLRYSNIAFDPMKSDHYKLVCVAIDGMDFRFMVYSSESTDWRVTDDEIGNVTWVDYDFDNGIFWNGDMHFIGKGESQKLSIICFDVRNEKIRSSMPRIPKIYGNCYFGKAGGDLCLVGLKNPKLSETKFHVFTLKRDYSGWALKYRVDFAPLIAKYPGIREISLSCFVLRGKKAMIVISMEGKLVSFDINNKEVDELAEVTGRPYVYREGEVFEHVESFAMI